MQVFWHAVSRLLVNNYVLTRLNTPQDELSAIPLTREEGRHRKKRSNDVVRITAENVYSGSPLTMRFKRH
jgi:hypothetical protein